MGCFSFLKYCSSFQKRNNVYMYVCGMCAHSIWVQHMCVPCVCTWVCVCANKGVCICGMCMWCVHTWVGLCMWCVHVCVCACIRGTVNTFGFLKGLITKSHLKWPFIFFLIWGNSMMNRHSQWLRSINHVQWGSHNTAHNYCFNYRSHYSAIAQCSKVFLSVIQTQIQMHLIRCFHRSISCWEVTCDIEEYWEVGQWEEF